MRQSILYFFVNIWLSLSEAIEIINQDISGDTIHCSQNDDCILMCDGNNGGNCARVSMICQNIDSGICKLTCVGYDSCDGLSLTAINVKSVEIICGHGNGMCYVDTSVFVVTMTDIY